MAAATEGTDAVRIGKKWIRQQALLSDASVDAMCQDIRATGAKHGVWIHAAIELPTSKTIKDEIGKRHSYAWHSALASDAMRHSVALCVGPSQWTPYVPNVPKDMFDNEEDGDDDAHVVTWLDIPPFSEASGEHTPVLPLIPGTLLVVTPHRLSVEYMDATQKTIVLQDVLGEDAAPRSDLAQYHDSTTPPFLEVPAHRMLGDAIAEDFMRKTATTLRRAHEGYWALGEFVPGAPRDSYALAPSNVANWERAPVPEARVGLYDRVQVMSAPDVEKANALGLLYTQEQTVDAMRAVIVNKRAPAFYPQYVFVEQSRVLSGDAQKLLDVEFRVVRRIGIVISKTMWRTLYGIAS